jgi:hypothetical protein
VGQPSVQAPPIRGRYTGGTGELAVPCLVPHPTITDMDLEPMAVVFQLMRPTRPAWRLLGDDGLARMNESGRRVHGPTA